MFHNTARNPKSRAGATTPAPVVLLAMMTALAGFIAIADSSPVSAATFHFRGGVQDNWVLPTEPATPSAGMQIRFGPGPFAPYDHNAANRRFLETFEGFPTCITGAHLTMGIKPLASELQAANDTIRFSFTDSSGSAVGPYWISQIAEPTADNSVLRGTWGNSFGYSSGVVKTFDLKNLQLGTLNTSGSTANLLPALRQYRLLDIDVQDDTSVDFIDLEITTLLGGDIDGDGCVDIEDFNLLLTNFNQPTPVGLGDPNGDGTYNSLDLAILQGDFGRCCPEPTSVALLALSTCGCGFLSWRSRDRVRKAEGSVRNEWNLNCRR